MGTATQIAVAGAQFSESFAFAPVERESVDTLLREYQQQRAEIDALVTHMHGPGRVALHHFISGEVEKLFNRESAICSLNSAYWDKALKLTDVYQYMPQERREHWNESIIYPAGRRKDWHKVSRDRTHHPEWFDRHGTYLDERNSFDLPPLPEFTDETVHSTLRDLMYSREKFFAERVDGLFRALSRTHVTNRPEGFGKRMILSGFGTSDKNGYISDLRAIVAKLMGRDEPHYQASQRSYQITLKRRGEWQMLDGGALRIRAYKCGTAHLEVHPSIAWRLNNILAFLHPAAVPSQFRQPPKRQAKVFPLFDRILPFSVLEILAQLGRASHKVPNRFREEWEDIPNSIESPHIGDKALRAAVRQVLTTLGGTEGPRGWFFDYDALPVLEQVVCTGRIPDTQAHQFYPTPATIAEVVAFLAQIGPGLSILEPSAGFGTLADYLPKDQTVCVEVSPLHCGVLRARGYTQVVEADFIEWADRTAPQFDRVVMNPPFSDGRWQLHLERALACVRPGGRLVAVLPASARGKTLWNPGQWSHEWSEPYADEFVGTSVSVVILSIDRL